MRFFEFKLPALGSDFSAEIEADLQTIAAALDEKPELEKQVNQELEKLLKQADSILAKNAGAAPVQKQPQQPPLDQTKENLDEDAATYTLIDDLNATIDQICAAVKNCDAIVKPFKDKIKQLRSMVEKELASALQKGKETRDIEIQQFFSGLEDQLKQLAAKAAPDAKTLKEIVIRFKSSFSDTILRDRKITQEDFATFLNDAINGRVIDMENLVKSQQGNIESYIKDPKHKEIFNIIKDDIFGYVPGGTGANLGPGEVALTMFGNPIRKGDVGDLEVNGIMYEVKGGRTTGKESGYGGRLNGKAVLKPTSGMRIITNYFAQKLPKVDPTMKGKTGKTVSRFNWNSKGISNLNNVVSESIKRKDLIRKFNQGLMLELWKTLITNNEEIKNFDNRVIAMVDPQSGIIDPANAMRISTELLYESYALSDGQLLKGKRQFNIIVLNAGTLNYRMIRKSQDISNVQIVGGISWNDANQSSSPQLYIP